MSKFIIERSSTKKGTCEIWKLNNRKGYYNFISYVAEEEVEHFKGLHKKDEIVEKL